jgi:hypothetical protein
MAVGLFETETDAQMWAANHLPEVLDQVTPIEMKLQPEHEDFIFEAQLFTQDGDVALTVN